MRLIGILVLLLGIGMAGGAIVYAKKIFSQFEARSSQVQAQTTKPASVPLLVATERLRYGQKLEKKFVRVVDWPANSVPPGAFANSDDLFGKDLSERRVVLRDIEPGEPILEGKVTGFGEDPRVAMRLGDGRRAFSLQIDAVTGVAGFVAPGDRVDIILTETRGQGMSSRVILSDILVIAVDQRAQASGINAQLGRTATLDVDTRQAQVLALAQQLGRLSLTLRGVGEETAEEDNTPVNIDDVLQREVEIATPVDPVNTVRVRRGGGAVENVQVE